MARRKTAAFRGHGDRSRATSEGMRRSAAIAAQYGITRGQKDGKGLTRKDRIFRVVCDAQAAEVEVTPELVRQLLPVEAETISPSTFERFVEMAIAGEDNVPEGRSWPKESRGYRGDPSAHAERVSKVNSKVKPPNDERSRRSTTTPKPNRQPDPLIRQQVETAAVKVATDDFSKLRYTVDSVERDNVGWDLGAVRGESKLRLEMKGLSGSQLCVELTPNEYAQMQKYGETYRLCVVTNALTDPVLAVFRYSEQDKFCVDQNGRQLKIEERVAVRCRAA